MVAAPLLDGDVDLVELFPLTFAPITFDIRLNIKKVDGAFASEVDAFVDDVEVLLSAMDVAGAIFDGEAVRVVDAFFSAALLL